MSHALRVGVADQIGYFRAYNTDGSAKTDLTSSTPGLALSVFRIGASAVSISSLSAKAADNTAHADGAIRAVSGNLYTVDLPDAACADQVPSISVKGSYTGGVIEGPEHPLIGYNPASVAVGANTTTPPTAAANASAVRTELATELARVDAAISTRSTFAGGAVASVTGNVGGNVAGSVGSVTGAVVLDSASVTAVQSGLALETTSQSIKAKTDNLPTDPADQSAIEAAITAATSPLATAANLATVAGYLDTEIADILADTQDIQTRLPAALEGGRIAAALDSATNTQIDNIENASGYLLAVLAGECADPQTASETYAITVFGSTFTVDMAGQTSAGTRTAPSLTKT